MASPTPVIIDTDPGVDDILGILLALASPEIEIKAITINFGNTDVESSYFNVLKLWKTLEDHFLLNPDETKRFPVFISGSGEFPILAKGSSMPLGGEAIYAQYFHGRDGLSDISTRHPELSIPHGWKPSRLHLSNASAIDVSLEILQSLPPRTLTYIALGPLTNLACMMRKDSTCVRDRIGRVIAMGGSLEAPGNVTPTAEFNFYADPFAVQELLHSEDPSQSFPLDRFILVPLDITTKYRFAFSDYRSHVDTSFVDSNSPSNARDKSPLIHFTSSFLERTIEIMRKFGASVVELHDPVAIYCALYNPPSLGQMENGPKVSEEWQIKKRVFKIERLGEYTRGMLVVDRRQDENNYKEGANRAQEYAAVAHPNATTDAPIQTESEKQVEGVLLKDIEGVPVIVGGPRPERLIQLMLERIWGISLGTDDDGTSCQLDADQFQPIHSILHPLP